MQLAISSTSATAIWTLAAVTRPQTELLLVNLDQVANITVGDASVQPGDTSAAGIIPPQGSMSVPAGPWYAIADQPTGPMLQITPGGGNWSPSAVAIADQIATSGLALAIADEIAAQGISLFGNPKPIYNISASGSGGTGTGLFGVSLVPATGDTVTQDETNWQTVVGRPVQSMKIYQSELSINGSHSNWHTTATPSITACIALKARACLCYSPAGDPVTGAGTPTAKANMAASISALSALLTAGGAPAPVVTLWQEPQVSSNPFNNGAAYVGCVQYYANTDANGTGVRALAPLFYDGEGYHTDLAAQYYPGSAYVDGIAVDYYGGDWFANKSLATWHNLDPTKPFGIWEMGNSAAGAAYSQTQITQYIQGLQAFLVGILNAGGTVDAAMWYQNNQNTGGVNLITSASDFRIPLLQALCDAITATAPTPGLPIAAGATATLTALAPSPGGAYAAAQGIGYDIVINAIAGAGSTLPFLQVQLFWHDIDTPGAQSVARQAFYVPMGANNTSGTIINGQGPQSGALLAVKITNLDSVTGYVNLTMLSTGRQQNAHRWVWSAGASVNLPAFNAPDGVTPVVLPTGATYAKILCSETVTLAAGAKKAFLCGMHTGNIWVRLQPKTDNVFDVVLQQPVADQVTVYHEDSAATDNDLLIVAPRTPLVALITNTGTGSGSFTFGLVAED